MANQPKKYKKFVATAATATLVASAIVPVASAAGFSDVAENNSHAEAINALVEAGIIKGFEDGTFGPNKELTRGHVVKMLGKWVEAQGFEIPADYTTVQRFDDVAVDAADQELVKYAALVKDTGVFVGSEGDLNAAGSISRENMALTLDRAYKAVFGKSLVELAAGSTNLTVSDLALAKEEAREEIQALRNLGISNVDTFNPKNTVTRGQFASFLNRTIEADATPAEGTAIKSATATAVNQVTVVFDGAVNTEAAKFAFARGTTAINVTKVEWNESKTEAILTVDTKFVDATYTLTVSGVAEKDLTASIKTTKEVATSIEFLSNALTLTGNEDKANGTVEAKITFAVYNQYGEDITDDIATTKYKEPKVSGIKDEKAEVTAKGVITVDVDEDEDEGTKGTIELTYEDGDIEIDVEQEVELSEQAEPATVEILDIYNENDEEITTANVKDGEKFYILFNVKDQYGVEMDAEDAEKGTTTGDAAILENVKEGLRINVSNDDIFEIDDEEEDIEVLNIDGDYYFAVKLTFPDDEEDMIGGENTVTFKSKATGEESSKTFKVDDSSKVHKIDVSAPEDVVAGDEEVKLPVSVYDQFGELITDAADLNDDLSAGKIVIKPDNGLVADWDAQQPIGSFFTFIEENGQVFLVFDSASNTTDEAKEYDLDIEVDESGEESSIALDVEPNAYAETIVALKKDVVTDIYNGFEVEVGKGDFIVEDQYGREYDKDGYSLEAIENSDKIVVENSVDGKLTIPSGDNTDFVIQSADSGSGSIEFKLTSTYTEDGDTKTAEDSLTVTFRTVDEDDFDSYVVKSDGVIYTTGDTLGVEVYGVTGTNKEVELPKSAYKVLASGYLKPNADASDVEVTEKALSELSGAKTEQLVTGIAVVINEDGTRINHEVKIDEADPKVVKLEVEDQDSVSGKLLTSLDLNITDADDNNDDIISATELVDALLLEGKFDIEDQYDDVDLTHVSGTAFKYFNGDDETLLLTISNVNDSDDEYKIAANGTGSTQLYLDSHATEDGVKVGDSFTLTLSIDGVQQSIKVYVK